MEEISRSLLRGGRSWMGKKFWAYLHVSRFGCIRVGSIPRTCADNDSYTYMYMYDVIINRSFLSCWGLAARKVAGKKVILSTIFHAYERLVENAHHNTGCFEGLDYGKHEAGSLDEIIRWEMVGDGGGGSWDHA